MADRRDDLEGADRAVSDALDELNYRFHGMTAGWAYPAEFRRFLAERGFRMTRTPRVWLDGDDSDVVAPGVHGPDEVPAGVFTYKPRLGPTDEDAVEMLGWDGEPTTPYGFGPLVEVVLPDDCEDLVRDARRAREQRDSTGKENPGG